MSKYKTVILFAFIISFQALSGNFILSTEMGDIKYSILGDKLIITKAPLGSKFKAREVKPNKTITNRRNNITINNFFENSNLNNKNIKMDTTYTLGDVYNYPAEVYDGTYLRFNKEAEITAILTNGNKIIFNDEYVKSKEIVFKNPKNLLEEKMNLLKSKEDSEKLEIINIMFSSQDLTHENVMNILRSIKSNDCMLEIIKYFLNRYKFDFELALDIFGISSQELKKSLIEIGLFDRYNIDENKASEILDRVDLTDKGIIAETLKNRYKV